MFVSAGLDFFEDKFVDDLPPDANLIEPDFGCV